MLYSADYSLRIFSSCYTFLYLLFLLNTSLTKHFFMFILPSSNLQINIITDVIISSEVSHKNEQLLTSKLSRKYKGKCRINFNLFKTQIWQHDFCLCYYLFLVRICKVTTCSHVVFYCIILGLP